MLATVIKQGPRFAIQLMLTANEAGVIGRSRVQMKGKIEEGLTLIPTSVGGDGTYAVKKSKSSESYFMTFSAERWANSKITHCTRAVEVHAVADLTGEVVLRPFDFSKALQRDPRKRVVPQKMNGGTDQSAVDRAADLDKLEAAIRSVNSLSRRTGAKLQISPVTGKLQAHVQVTTIRKLGAE